MITPRTTRLIRAAHLPAMRQALFSLSVGGSFADIRRRVVIVPSRAAGLQLRRTFEDIHFQAAPSAEDAAIVLPDLLTRDDWYRRMHERAGVCERRLTALEREVILGAAAREAIESGAKPPFRLRPGLVAEMLAFYDALVRQERTVDRFERLVVGDLESRADTDRGAERLLRQTRFLVATFRAFEARVADSGALDESTLRRRLLEPSALPGFSHIVVAVGDRAAEPSGGLFPADFDLMMRLPGVEAIDLVATRGQLAAGLHERVRNLIPGLDEVDVDGSPTATRLLAPADDAARPYFTGRDREEELRGIARRIKSEERGRSIPRPLDRVAVVFRRPLPYVYLARTVFEAAGIEFQVADALPLAAEPMAAVLDLLCAVAESGCTRSALVAVLRCPHIRCDPDQPAPSADDIDAFDRGLAEAHYLGDPETLTRLAGEWSGSGAAAARAAAALAFALGPLGKVDRVSVHAETLSAFLHSHERMDFHDEVVTSRHLRARGAVVAAIEDLRRAALAFDDPRARFSDVAATVRRWIESETFTPRRGERGVQLLDVNAARFGAFDVAHIAGLTEADWPEPAAPNIFYPSFLLSELGWPQESARLSSARAAFLDLLTLPRERASVSTFTLEDDSIVNPSPLLEDLAGMAAAAERVEPCTTPVFVDEALTAVEPAHAAVSGQAAAWLDLRSGRAPATDARFHGDAGSVRRQAHTVTAIDRFLQCPFKYFAATILELPEEVADEPSMNPRAEGQFIHEVFRAFFEAWQAGGGKAVTVDALPEARALFAAVAGRMLGTLPAAEAALRRLRLLGSVGTPGLGEVVLAAEASRQAPVLERMLEYPLVGEFVIAADGVSRALRLNAKADRVDLLADGRFRLIDYKNSRAPEAAQTIQLPIYAVCVQQQLRRTRGETWEVAEAAYIAFGERKAMRTTIAGGADAAEKLVDGQRRLLEAVGQIERGHFPPRPATPRLCSYCEFATVCRKDYVDGD